MAEENRTDNHSFAILSYKDSVYIEALIASLFAQTIKSEIIISTSTPTDKTYEIAKKNNIKVFVNPESGKGIGADWNFAFSAAETEYVTLAHQDDIYEPLYTEKTIAALARAKNPILAYTKYYEIRPEGVVTNNRLLRIKSLMNKPIGVFPKSRFVRNRVLSMGCPISCPSVTYNKKRFPDFKFITDMKTDLDWDAWYSLSNEMGEFVYIRDYLVGHRVHIGSETTNGIGSGARSAEDLIMYKRYWPDGIARFLHRQYEKGLKSNYV